MRHIIVCEKMVVHRGLLDISILLAVVFGLDNELVAVLQVQRHFVKVGRAYDILVTAGTHRVEAHCREHIPCRGLSVVLVATIAVGIGTIELVHDLA